MYKCLTPSFKNKDGGVWLILDLRYFTPNKLRPIFPSGTVQGYRSAAPLAQLNWSKKRYSLVIPRVVTVIPISQVAPVP